MGGGFGGDEGSRFLPRKKDKDGSMGGMFGRLFQQVLLARRRAAVVSMRPRPLPLPVGRLQQVRPNGLRYWENTNLSWTRGCHFGRWKCTMMALSVLQSDRLTHVSNELLETYSAKYTRNLRMISQRWLITCSLGIYGYSYHETPFCRPS